MRPNNHCHYCQLFVVKVTGKKYASELLTYWIESGNAAPRAAASLVYGIIFKRFAVEKPFGIPYCNICLQLRQQTQLQHSPSVSKKNQPVQCQCCQQLKLKTESAWPPHRLRNLPTPENILVCPGGHETGGIKATQR